MIKKFKGYTYAEYQNEMCDKAIESDDKELYSEMFGEDYRGFEEEVPSVPQTTIKEVE